MADDWEQMAEPDEMADSNGDLYSHIVDSEPVSDASAENENPNRETAPKRVGKSVPAGRQSTEGLFTLAYGGIGTMLIHTGTDIPVGRVLQFQAPIAGAQLDSLIMGSWLDKLLQPFVKYQGMAEGAASLVLLPLLVGAYERNPALGTIPIFEQVVRSTLHSTLMDLAPALKAQKAKEKKAARELADLHGLGADMFGDISDPIARKAAMDDPVGAVMQMIFAPVPGTETTEETE